MGIVGNENIMSEEFFYYEYRDINADSYYTQSRQAEEPPQKEDEIGSVFSSQSSRNYSTSPIFSVTSTEDIPSFETNNPSDDDIYQALLLNKYLHSKNKNGLNNYPVELVKLSNNKLDVIEKAFEELKDKNLSDEEMLEEINKVISTLKKADDEFLDNIFNNLKDNPEELEKLLNAKINGAESKEQILENKIEEYCAKNGIKPEMQDKIIELIKNANIQELENLNKKASDKNSPLSNEQISGIKATTEIHIQNITDGKQLITPEQMEQEKEKIQRILNSLPKEDRERITKEIGITYSGLVEKLKAAKSSDDSFEARKLAMIEYDTKMRDIMKDVTKTSILHHIAGKSLDESTEGREKTKGIITRLEAADLRRKLFLAKTNKEKEWILKQELENTDKKHLAYMKGAEEAFNEKPTEKETVDATLATLKEATEEHVDFTAKDAPKEEKLTDELQKELEEISKKIKEKLDKIHERAIEEFWESPAGHRCLEYTQRIVEYRREEFARRKRAVKKLRTNVFEKKQEAVKKQKEAAIKKEKSDNIKKTILAKTQEMKKKMGLSSSFRLTDSMLKVVDFQLATKKQRAEAEYSKARKDMLDAESDFRLACKFLDWEKKMADFEKTLCNIYETFLG